MITEMKITGKGAVITLFNTCKVVCRSVDCIHHSEKAYACKLETCTLDEKGMCRDYECDVQDSFIRVIRI